MQLLLRVPDPLGERFKRAVPSRQRNAFLRKVLEDALPPESDPLFAIAAQAEAEAHLGDDMTVWDEAVGDGLDASR